MQTLRIVTFLSLLFSQQILAKTYRPSTRDTFLDRLMQRDPDEYLRCMQKGPTDYHRKKVLCARATRLMLSCARPNEPEVYCGGYAFTYYGTGCMERLGYVNLLEHNPKPAKDHSICQAPGAMWVYYGRCNKVSDNGRIPSSETCHRRMKKLLGESQYQKELNSHIKRYMGPQYNMSREQAYRMAFSGDRYGHMDLIGYRYNKTFNSINTRVIDFYTYLISPVPADHYRTGQYHGKRILKACYLPRADANRILGY